MAKNYAPKPGSNPENPTTILAMPTFPTPLKPYQNPNHHPKPKTHNKNSKCLVYLLAFFVLLCLSLLVFGSVVLRTKSPVLTITSVSIKSLRYDLSPSFNFTLFMTLSVKNLNFGHFQLNNQDPNRNFVRLIYGNVSSVVGESRLGFKTGRVRARGKEEIRVVIKVGSSYYSSSETEDRERAYSDLNSGYLELMGFGTIKGKVHLLKDKFVKSRVAVMKCTIGIDLRNALIRKFEC